MLAQIVHPKKFRLKNITFEVIAHVRLTDTQAENAVRLFCKLHKLTKKHEGRTLQVFTQIDEDKVGLF